jgi:mannose/fructose/sorbose-specific phosphotransferase system IIA component
MINILLVSHGNLSEQLIKSAEMIAGPAENVYALTLQPGEKPETFSEKIDETMAKIGDQEVLILIDILCGTPYNVTARQVLKDNVECVTGANLPMLIEAMLSRDGVTVSELAETITGVGANSVKNLKPFLRGE